MRAQVSDGDSKKVVSQLMDKTDRLVDSGEGLFSQAKSWYRQASDILTDTAQKGSSAATKAAQNHPLPSLFGAAAFGYLIARLARRKS